jgi:transketolase
MEDSVIKELEEKAKIIRRNIIKMLAEAGSGHSGGSLSCVEILTALYFKVMRHNPKEPKWSERDRFVLSKGHAAPALYATLAEAGYFPKEWLWSLRKTGSPLQGHIDCKKTPGVEISTGSLGQGLSVANGMAIAGKIDKKNYRVFVLIGDGESQEGQIWEAAMAASHYKLDNLVAIMDRNKLQIDGSTENVMNLEPVSEKWQAFGWKTIEIDGHNFKEILNALSPEKIEKGKPTIVIAHTLKGKGVSFMEGVVDFHGKAPTKEEAEKALKELK